MGTGWVSDVDWGVIAKVLGGLIPLVVSLIGFARGPGALRSRLKHDAEVLEKIPAESSAHAGLLQLIEVQVDRIAKLETEASRNWNTFVGALVAAPVCFWGAAAIAASGPWLGAGGVILRVVLAAAVGFVGVACLYGIFESAQRVPRDENGDRI